MNPPDPKKLVVEIKHDLESLNVAFRSVVNGVEPIEKLAEAIEEWEQRRQKYNDRNIGVLVAIETFKVVTFSLLGDPERDLKQSNERKNVDNTDFVNDKDFLKKLHIDPTITPDEDKKP